MDELAGRYLTLCLRLSRLVPGLVEWYVGPDRLLAAVHSEPRRLPDRLAAEADRLAADVATEATLPTDRAGWLAAQLVCIGSIGRARAGDVPSFDRHLQHVLGVEADLFDQRRAEAARALVDELLPGTGPLKDRVHRYLETQAISRARTIQLFGRAVALLRARTQRAFTLPEDEYVELRPGAHATSGSQPRPDGRTATKVAVSARATSLAAVLDDAARTTYPGEHTIRVLRAALLVEQFGRGECTLEVRSSPGRVASVGAAAVGARALLAPHERELLLDQLADSIGAEVDARMQLLVHDALDDLDDAIPAAALALHVGNTRRARQLLVRYQLRPHPGPDAMLGSLVDREVATVAAIRPYGRRLALGFLDKQEDPVAGYRRLVTEQLTPAALASGR